MVADDRRTHCQPHLSLEESVLSEGPLAQEQQDVDYKQIVAVLPHDRHPGTAECPSSKRLVGRDDDEGWLRAHLSIRWARRRETQAGEEWDGNRPNDRKLERVANKKMWGECKAMVLKDWKTAAGVDCSSEIQELLDLQAFYDIQKAELSARTTTPYPLLGEAILARNMLAEAASSHLSGLERQSELAGRLLDMCKGTMLRAHTRVRRLMAEDVKDEAGRKEEARRRLRHPRSLEYMMRAKTELEAARVTVASTQRHLGEIDGELDKVILSTVDTIGALKDAMLALAFDET